MLIVHQYTAPGAPQDQQRGPMYTPLFEEAGLEVRYVGRHPIEALRWSEPRSRLAALMREQLGYLVFNRARDRVITWLNDWKVLRCAQKFDIVVLIKTDSAQFVRRLRRRTRSRLIYDLADVRRRDAALGAGGVDGILESVDAVTSDNMRGVVYARRHASSVHLWPPSAYVEQFDTRRALSSRGRGGVVLGWIGTPSTVSNLYSILESLEDVFQMHPDLRLRLLGVPKDHEILGRFEHVRASCLPAYDAEAMVREVLDMDIGLFPMFDLEDAAMHGITKALIYMGGGAAAVCSPVGDCRDLVRDGENGMLAAGRAEWTAKLDALIRDSQLRSRLAARALDAVRDEYSLRACFARLRPALEI